MEVNFVKIPHGKKLPTTQNATAGYENKLAKIYNAALISVVCFK